MEYVAQGGRLTPVRPGPWAAVRENEGCWYGVSAPDHVTASMSGPVGWNHVFVTLAEMACATTRLHLYPAFGNNLTRSPVEFAQAALALQSLSGGRYEAALGAGWARDEVEAMGGTYPDDAARARRFSEALRIVRELLHTGACKFSGEHYEIDVSGLSPLDSRPPPLVAAIAGSWTARHIPPLVDRVELALPGVAHPMRGGMWDASRLGELTMDHIARMCDRVRRASPSVAISCGVLYGVGDPTVTAELRARFGNGLIGSLVGDAAEVAHRLRAFSELGIDRVTMIALVPGSPDVIAPHLQP